MSSIISSHGDTPKESTRALVVQKLAERLGSAVEKAIAPNDAVLEPEASIDADEVKTKKVEADHKASVELTEGLTGQADVDGGPMSIEKKIEELMDIKDNKGATPASLS